VAFSRNGKEKAAKAARSSLPEAVSELDASQNFSEDPLEALLDEQSDEDFGDLQIKERSGKPVKLAEWSAQDFSSIYLRFRPHLERHARRFLRNPSQVDEVVQDAFLYLMVSLPELDSEIGVLRFLKWKTRLLALDVIRASGRSYIHSIDDVQEPASDDPEISSSLEQQDDAAVVKLALSKLNPRHREVLIASMYEEKSTEQIAAQVGLSENATRQLIFRARAAFKKALIGDVDTTGMSAAAILSVAARKAASEGKKVGAAALTLIALVVMSFTAFPGLNRAPADQMADAPTSSSSESSQTDAGVSKASPEVEISPTPDSQSAESNDSSSEADSEVANNAAGSASSTKTISSPSTKASPTPIANDAKALANVFSSNGSKSRILFQDQVIKATSRDGISAEFTFNPTAEKPFTEVSALITINDILFMVYPETAEWVVAIDPQGLEHYVYFGSMKYVFDENGKVWSESKLAKGSLRIEVIMDRTGVKVQEVILNILPKG
jgi:RNA polymerase sigma-70 factor (ECF subfamily)